MKHDLESLASTDRFCITFSPPRTRFKRPSLEAFYCFPPFTLLKFHVSFFVYSHTLIAFYLPLFPCSSTVGKKPPVYRVIILKKMADHTSCLLLEVYCCDESLPFTKQCCWSVLSTSSITELSVRSCLLLKVTLGTDH